MLEQRQDDQEYRIRSLQFLFRNFVSQDELDHLRKLKSDNPEFLFTQTPTTKFFEQELNHMRSMRLITNKEGMYLHTLTSQQKANVKDYFEITERGKEYVTLLDEFEKAISKPPLA